MQLKSLLAPLCAATLLALAGCASDKVTNAPATEPPPPSSSSEPALQPEPVALRKRAELDYEQLKAAVKSRPSSPRLRAALAGKSVHLSLVRSERPRDAAQHLVDPDDGIVFRCRKNASFQGGDVVARIQDARFESKAKRAVIDLDDCAALPKDAAKPVNATPSAALGAAAPSGAAKPGMDAQGNVVDSSKVESGSGRLVKGLNDYEGEITGKPARGSKFGSLQIGMSVRQVSEIVGQPTDQGAYMTGKAWIPFYMGADRHRFEMTYKGQGRLIFAGGGMGDLSNGHLIWIIHNANEPGYR
ncbi:hypothetical protein [Variovorax paradoxus]|uniref:hypothetical protein n=1 Tax=Variovorax paradoxus TaxID=34073 RepID=UPI003D65A575